MNNNKYQQFLIPYISDVEWHIIVNNFLAVSIPNAIFPLQLIEFLLINFRPQVFHLSIMQSTVVILKAIHYRFIITGLYLSRHLNTHAFSAAFLKNSLNFFYLFGTLISILVLTSRFCPFITQSSWNRRKTDNFHLTVRSFWGPLAAVKWLYIVFNEPWR